MNTPPVFHTRREFLRSSVLGGALAWTLPAFINNTFVSLAAAASDRALQTVTGRDHPILIVLQLAGGNDGLNTVVPFANDEYHNARPKLALAGDKILQLREGLGLNGAMPELHRLFHEGDLTILQNVGYPNPNRSHFRSMEIWQTASDSDRVAKQGWLGSYFDNACEGEDATVGISLGRQLPQAFHGKSGKGIAAGIGVGAGGGMEKMMEMGSASEEDGSTVTDFSGEFPQDGEVLNFLRRTELDGLVSSQQISRITKASRPKTEFPNSALGLQLRTISQLIAGGMPTRVYYATQGGYDTHSNQAQSHERLLGELDSALGALMKELAIHGLSERVLVMTFSEFGRRVAGNASGGTDHGAAAPMFLLGGPVKGGIVGSSPDLGNLNRGDLKHELDFRGVYGTILDKWLQTDSRKVLGRKFDPVPIWA